MTRPRVSVAVLCTSGEPHLSRCLASLYSQHGAPPFDVTVIGGPGSPGIDAHEGRVRSTRIVRDCGGRSSLALASRALHECQGDLVLLTKDHCVPAPDWVRTMVESQREGRAAVGGRVEIAHEASAVDWAYYFIDFFRYAAPTEGGPVQSLSVCNVSYQRHQLEAVRAVWEGTFVETAVNGALEERFGVLWLNAASEVVSHRHLTLREAIVERYKLGRQFGCSRLTNRGAGYRAALAVFAPALPFLFMARMVRAASRSRRHSMAFLRSLAPLSLIVFSRSMGEWLGYLTRRP